jgi:hypothetical protein
MVFMYIAFHLHVQALKKNLMVPVTLSVTLERLQLLYDYCILNIYPSKAIHFLEFQNS